MTFFHEELGPGALDGVPPAELAQRLQALVRERGVGFRSAGGATDFVVDPVPRVISAADWKALEAGLIQRVRALNAFVADVYGPRRAVAEGVVPARVIESAECFEPAMCGLRPPGDMWVGIAGLDVVRDEHGELLVLEDNLRTPSGIAYAVEARRAVLELLHPPQEPLPLDGVPEMLAGTLRAASPGPQEPYAIVLTDGPDNSAAFEHAWLADALGLPLLEPGDLALRGDVLRHGARTVDVVYRRSDADMVDTGVGALLTPPARAGTLGIVNAFGTGVADDKLAHAYVEDMVRFFLGEEPLLRSVETFDLGDAGTLERALDVFDELVIKPRVGHGGIGVVICAHAERADVEALREAVRMAPGEYIAQRLVRISLHPTVIDGELQPRHVDLRPFVFMHGGTEAAVMPGALTRVAFEEGALVVNSTQNGGAKDTWVMP